MVKRHGNTLGEYITADAIDALFQIFPVGHGAGLIFILFLLMTTASAPSMMMGDAYRIKVQPVEGMMLNPWLKSRLHPPE
jgi:hypothetical protein